MNPFVFLLTALLGINASYELGRNIGDQKQRKREKALARAGRDRIRHVAHLLAREGGRGAAVKWYAERDGSGLMLTVVRWPAGKAIPVTYMGYPVQEPADTSTSYKRGPP